jgi:signal transduction histidine kinase
MRWAPRVSLGTRLRIGLVVAALAFAAIAGTVLAALPWAVLVLTLDLTALAVLSGAGGATSARRTQAFALLCLAGVAAGASMAFSGLGTGVLLLVPAFSAGWHYGRRRAALVPVCGTLSALATTWSLGRLTQSLGGEIALWGVESVILGLVAAWWNRRDVVPPVDPTLAEEASQLLHRLQELADSLETGFDAPAAAEMALQDLAAQMRSSCSAVLVAAGDAPAVPLAVRGADRAPWPDPTEPGSVLWDAWHDGQPTLSRWEGDDGVVPRSVLAVPLSGQRGERTGVLVADRPFNTPFHSGDLPLAAEVAERHAPHIDLSMAFAGLRERAAVEERERLAREMHDGIAQEMVALGFGIDALRRSAHSEASPLAPGLDEVRQELTRVLADLRLHIADLRIAVRPETGLGALIGSRLQGFGASRGVTTTMQLSETGFRLPAHTEVLVYRLFLQVLADAKRAADATQMHVVLTVAAPLVELRMSHDGTSSLAQEDFASHPLGRLGGTVTVQTHHPKGVLVRAHLRARRNATSAQLFAERIPQSS